VFDRERERCELAGFFVFSIMMMEAGLLLRRAQQRAAASNTLLLPLHQPHQRTLNARSQTSTALHRRSLDTCVWGARARGGGDKPKPTHPPMRRARAPASLLALLARQHHHQQLQVLGAAAARQPVIAGSDDGGRTSALASASSLRGSAAAAAAAASAAAAATPTPAAAAWRWADPAHSSHHHQSSRTFFSWGGRGGGGSTPKQPPVDLDGSGPPAPPPLVTLDDAAAAAAATPAALGSSSSSSSSSISSPTAAGTGLDRFDAAAATSSSSSAAAMAAPTNLAEAADLSAAAGAVLNASRSAEAEAFVAAAADVWAPTRAFMGMLEAASEAWGLPWWATIALVNLAVRLGTLPLTVYTQKKAGGVAQLNEKMAAVRELAAAQSRATSMREYQALQARRASAMAELQAKHGGELRSSLVVPALGVLNAVVLVSQFSAVSTLAGEAVPSMARGGTLWFPDLTVPDSKYGLAAICSALTLAMVEFGGLSELGATGAVGPGMRWLMRGMALLFLPAGAYVPAAVGVLWTGNAVLSLAQSTALRQPGVRKALGLPDVAKLRATAHARGGGLFGGMLGGAGGAGGGAAAAGGGAGGGAAASSAASLAPPPGQAPVASSLLSTGRLYAQPAASRKHANQIRAEVERRATTTRR
jgi:membrane protein insertase Oxa1/YidC/SpoIIIJ